MRAFWTVFLLAMAVANAAFIDFNMQAFSAFASGFAAAASLAYLVGAIEA